jgi:hypothetical protein
MDAIQCDRCKEIGNADTIIGWFKVQPIGIDVSRFRDPLETLHFDSLKCLTDWAMETAGVTDGQA